jgi:hypothetical protein
MYLCKNLCNWFVLLLLKKRNSTLDYQKSWPSHFTVVTDLVVLGLRACPGMSAETK